MRLGLGVLALIVAGGAYGLSRLDEAPAELDRDAAWLGTVTRGPMSIEVRAPGRLVPEVERWVAAPVAGVVERVLALPGRRLEAGDALVELSNPALERQLLDAELTVRAEDAQLAALSARLDNDALDLRATLAGLESRLEDARLTHDANERLAADGLVSSIELTRSRFRVEELTRLREIELERVERRHGARDVELDALRARVDRARALARDLERQVDSLTVRVAAPGIVTEVRAEPGLNPDLERQVFTRREPA